MVIDSQSLDDVAFFHLDLTGPGASWRLPVTRLGFCRVHYQRAESDKCQKSSSSDTRAESSVGEIGIGSDDCDARPV